MLESMRAMRDQLTEDLDRLERWQNVLMAWQADAPLEPLRAPPGDAAPKPPTDTAEPVAAQPCQEDPGLGGNGTASPETSRCLECGAPFAPRRGGKRKLYCARKCREQAEKRRRRALLCASETPPAPEPPAGHHQAQPPITEPPIAAEPDPRIGVMLHDLGKLPAATSVFGPRPEPPAVPFEA